MKFLELAKKRFSSRKFSNNPVEKDKLKLILEAGWVAPTAANRQPHTFLVLEKPESLEKLKKAGNFFNAPLAIILCGNQEEAWVRSYDDKSSLDTDNAIVATHMMLQVEELGLGCCWIGYFNPEIIKKEFSLPENIEPLNVLAIGYSVDNFKEPDRHSKTRKPFDSLIVKESF